MSRSRELTRGSRWRIFGLLLLLIFFYFIAAAILGVVAAALGLDDEFALSIVQAITGTAATLLVAAMSASLYVELRTVKEGATAESLATIFE